MLREQARTFLKINILADLLVLITSFVLSYILRGSMGGALQPAVRYAWVLLLILPIWVFWLHRFGLYSSLRRDGFARILWLICKVQILGGMSLFTLVFIFDRDAYSRGLLVLFLFVSTLCIALWKILVKVFLGHLRKRGYNTRHLLLSGTPAEMERHARIIEGHAEWGFVIIDRINLENADALESILQECRSTTVDEVVFCIPAERLGTVRSVAERLCDLGLTVRILLEWDMFERVRYKVNMFHHSIPVLTLHTKSLSSDQLFLKRILDLAGSTVGLMLCALMFPFVAFAIKSTSPGPIFFGQERIGENGRRFKCWKFRTMYIDAEERKKELMAQNEMQGAMFKMRNDPRITPVGNFLRKTSLDEFPQFWNVFMGEMSLVGTRPPTPAEVEQYEDWHRRRISIKPGITGLWQVSGRSSISDFDEIARLDIAYIDCWSVFTDVRILFRTVGVVLFQRGSC